MSAQLTLRNVTKSYAGRTVLDGVSLTVRPGEHVAVVGDNGSGKSTLLRLIAGEEQPDEGTVTVAAPPGPYGGGIGHLGQTPVPPSARTVREALDEALAGLRALERRLRELESSLTEERMAEYGDLLTAYEARGGYAADSRTDRALQALGLGAVDRGRALRTLSGGERARLGLACLLASAPRLMLLDEPANHLDERALTWLEGRLRAHRGTVVTVTHDRMFLDRVAGTIVEVADGRVTRHGGGYRAYLRERAAARQRHEQVYEEWRRAVAETERRAATTARRVAPGRGMKDGNKLAYDRDAGRVQSSVAGRVRQARERLRRLHRDAVPKPPQLLAFGGEFEAGPRTGPDTAPESAPETAPDADEEARAGTASLYGVRVGDRLHVPELHIGRGQRLLVRGPNGAGKSTLLHVLAGTLRPDGGTVRRHGRVGLLPQDPPAARAANGGAGQLRSLLAEFASGLPGTPEEHRERLLSLGLFAPDALDVPVGRLSVGQRQRLALARLLTRRTDLLLLDEPTNHLSPTLVEELEEALERYRGTLVVVSHDRTLARRFRGTRVHMREGRPEPVRPESGRPQPVPLAVDPADVQKEGELP
ncbi:macrolide transport system ATP-binding/permease protein [Streptomyces sp. Amel2xB2]|uniref:ribosomal protection-like ABC-F family protein n=1 Tax=Streptomyces sp. Amel2xB2 TaxID=1305829 RepID=UPI000DB9D602|nr:ABC-F family ATP-binding cassette domain-containing protein [Streptomyces sp. Amel2xB2]RAJ66977.1 macrolide transport system ATP-binding/permease protein [Streptomyces sp. Amel2xB2]